MYSYFKPRLPQFLRHLFLKFGGEFVGGCFWLLFTITYRLLLFDSLLYNGLPRSLISVSFMFGVIACIVFVLSTICFYLTRPIESCSQHNINTKAFTERKKAIATLQVKVW